MNDFGAAVADLPEADEKSPPEKNDGLAKILKGKRSRPRRVIVYGVDGVGKSTLANRAPSPIFIPTEEGLNDIDCESFPLATTWGEVDAYLQSLATNDHDYKTVVIDSLDWLERLIWAEVCREKGVAQIDEIGYGKGYSAAVDWWQQLIKALSYLRDHKGMGCVLTAHAKIEKFENPEGENYDQYALALHKAAAPILREWCDEVFFASYKVFTTTTEESFGKKSTKAIGGEERILRTQKKPFCYAKNRLGLPDEIPMEWSEYSKHFPS